MSDNVLILIPTDPLFVPSVTAARDAREALANLVPKAEEVIDATTDEVRFIDQGTNFERVVCPRCSSELDTEWWKGAMDASAASSFAVLDVTLPCCGKRSSLNDLRYEWPAGFARFVLEAMNPNVTDLTDSQIASVATIVGAPLRRIWAHY